MKEKQKQRFNLYQKTDKNDRVKYIITALMDDIEEDEMPILETQYTTMNRVNWMMYEAIATKLNDGVQTKLQYIPSP